MHFDLHNAAALAGFAAAALDVEAEPAGAVTALLGILGVGEEGADIAEHTGVGGRVGARGAANGRLVNADDLIDPFHTLNFVTLAGAAAGAVERCGQRLIQNFIDQRGLAGTGNTGHADHFAKGKIHRNVLQVVFPRFDHREHFAVTGAVGGGNFHKFAAGKVLAGHTARGIADILHAAGGHDLAAMHTGTGADIHNIVRLAHGVLVMLYYNQGVAQVAQALHGGNQLIVIALVQADAGFIQHIQHAGQCAADLGRQADALAFAAGKRRCAARQGQVPQTHALQKAQTLFDLFEDGGSDDFIPLGHFCRLDKFQLLVHAHIAELGNVDAAHRDSEAGGLQALAVAGGALLAGHDKGDFLLDPLAACFTEAALQVGDNALKRVHIGAGAEHILALHLDFFSSSAIQDGVHGFFAHLLDGGIQRKAIALAQRFVIHFRDGALRIIPAAGLDGTFADGLARIRNHAGRVHLHKGAQAGAGFTGAKGIVKAEHAGGKFVNGNTVLRAGIVLAELHRFPADDINDDKAAGQGNGSLNRIGQAAAHRIIDGQAVHDDFNGMLDILFQLDLFVQIIHVAVNAHAGVTAAAGSVQLLGLGAFAAPHNRGQHLEAGAFRQFKHLVYHLVHRLLADDASADRAVRNADAGIHQTEIIINFRHGAHGGTRVVAGGFLVNGNRRGKAGDLVHIGLFHLAQEHAGIAGKAFHIAALAVRKDGIKGQAGLAGAGKARHNNQLVARQNQVDVFQVMLPRALDRNAVVGINLNVAHFL